MIRVKHCCCGCTLDIGARIVIWADLIATIVIGLSAFTNAVKGMNSSDDYTFILSAMIIPVKLVILVGAIMGVNKKKASYLHPYIIYNVLAVITMGILILVAILKFDEIVDSDLMKPLMENWELAKQQYQREYYRNRLTYNLKGEASTPNMDILESPETEPRARVGVLILVIICGIVNFFIWTYFNVVLYSYYKTLMEGGNFTNVDGVEYFAPTEQIGGKGVPQGAIPQYNIPPTYFAAPPYPTQPVMPYSPAPPAYDEAAGLKAYANPSFPPTKQ